jgi:protein CLEC16A
MSEVWAHKEKLFINTYSQYIYKDCELPEDTNLNDKDELVKAI